MIDKNFEILFQKYATPLGRGKLIILKAPFFPQKK